MPLAPRLSEADSKTSTGVPCLYACIANAPSLLQEHSNRLVNRVSGPVSEVHKAA
jgi:hypothetical protein